MAERKSFLLRIDPGLWAELEAWAADELRSVNGQIEYLLKQAVARRRSATGSNNTDMQEGMAQGGSSATGKGGAPD